jgi:large subunit ribosomal protein L31e
MRSPGEFQGIFVGESHVDVVARRLGMDPLDFRLKNLVHEGDAMPDGAMYKDLRVEEALRTAAEARKGKSEDRALFIDPPVNEAIWARGIEKPPSRIRVRALKFEDGSVVVHLAE